MCLIIKLPKGVYLDAGKVDDAFYFNDDGWGLLAYDEANNKLHVEKSLSKEYSDFLTTYDKYKDMEVAIHFRTRTHGNVSLENCHPFKITDNIYMMHNGGFDIKLKGTRSDSNMFAGKLIAPALKGYLGDPEYLQYIESNIDSNRLLFFVENKFVILNEALGEKDDKGVWYSTDTYFTCSSYAWPLEAYRPDSTKALVLPSTSSKPLDKIYLSDGFLFKRV